MKSNSSKLSASPANDKPWIILIAVVSILVPLLVGYLLFTQRSGKSSSDSIRFLPAMNAGINSVVSLLLLAGKRMARTGKTQVHKTIMLTACFLSIVFLVSYLVYHAQAGDVKYMGDGFDKYFYLLILFSHILLSIVIVPMVLLAVFRAMKGNYVKHRAIVKWAWPIWLYVSVTGVLVYLFAHVINPL